MSPPSPEMRPLLIRLPYTIVSPKRFALTFPVTERFPNTVESFMIFPVRFDNRFPETERLPNTVESFIILPVIFEKTLGTYIESVKLS
jgi:hypothetical protein